MPSLSDPEDLAEVALAHEAELRRLHKRLRRTGHSEASQAALEAADCVLRAARSLGAEFPARSRRLPAEDVRIPHPELYIA